MAGEDGDEVEVIEDCEGEVEDGDHLRDMVLAEQVGRLRNQEVWEDERNF